MRKLFTFLLLISTVLLYAQSKDTTGNLNYMAVSRDVNKDLTQRIIPFDTTHVTYWGPYGSIAVKNGIFYYNNGTSWVTPATGASGIPVADSNQYGIGYITLAYYYAHSSNIDTGGLSFRINQRVKYSDTTSMLSAYLPKWLAAVLYQPVLGFTPENVDNKAINFSTLNNTFYPTTQAVANYVTANTIDTGGLSFRINKKVNYTDTGAMLSPYLPAWLAALTYQPIGSYIPTSRTITINGITQDLSANRTYNVGTVTSVGTGYGLIGGTITTFGTLVVDSTKITSQLRLTNMLGNYYLASNPSGYISTISGITAGGDLAGTYVNPTLALITTSMTVGDATHVPIITYDAKGRITGSTTAAIGGGTITSISTISPILGGTITTSGTISIQQATTTSDGYVSHIDWNTFNNKQAAGNYITALTGDGTATGPGSAALTLANTTVSVGSYGSATQVGTFTVDAKGRLTAASNTTISGVAPGGAAGGDLTGTYPNPTLVIERFNDLPPTAVQTGTITATANTMIPFDVSGGSGVVNLPNAPADGTTIAVKIVKFTSSNTVNVKAAGGDVFNVASGATTLVLSFLFNGDILRYKASTGIWYVLADDITPSYLNATYAPISLNITTASTTSNGYLKGVAGSMTFLTTIPCSDLSGTLAAAQFPALTGDITTTAGSLATTLKNTGTAGTYGSSSLIPIITTDAQGRITSVTTSSPTGANATAIQGVPVSTVSPTNPSYLKYNGTQWLPGSLTLGDPVLSGSAYGLFYYNVSGQLDQIINGTNNQLLLANTSAKPTWVTISGDWTIGSTGVVTIANSAITNAKVSASAAIAYSKLNLTASILLGDLAASVYNTTPTASTLVEFDANKNLFANNVIEYHTPTISTGGTITLTVGSAYGQWTTGTTTETYTLPVTSTLTLYQGFYFANRSTQNVTINSSGGNLVQTMAANTNGLAICTATSGTGAASWDFSYAANNSSPISATNGGTGLTSYTIGDVPYASATNTLSQLPIGSTNYIMTVTGGIPSWKQHIEGGGSTPTIAAGAGAGTSPTVSVSGSDYDMQVTIITGTLPTGTNATVATITYNATWSGTPRPVYSPANSATALLSGATMVSMDGASATTFMIISGTTGLVATTTYKWNVFTGK